MKAMAAEHWEAVSACPTSLSISAGGDLVGRPTAVRHRARVERHRPLTQFCNLASALAPRVLSLLPSSPCP